MKLILHNRITRSQQELGNQKGTGSLTNQGKGKYRDQHGDLCHLDARGASS